MPGPRSRPYARRPSGGVVVGKTALRAAGLKSGEGMEHDTPRPPQRNKTPKHDRSREDS